MKVEASKGLQSTTSVPSWPLPSSATSPGMLLTRA